MYTNIRDRKKYVDDTIAKSKKKVIASLDLSSEIMGMCYILASASIEYMVESILLAWAQKITKLHQNSKMYKGRKFTQIFLDVKIEGIEKKLENFQSSYLDRIENLLKEIAGEETKNRFKKIINGALVDRGMLRSKIENIVNYRHRIAHGQKTPKEESPNLDDLQKDYDLIYKNLIRGLIKSLPLPKSR